MKVDEFPLKIKMTSQREHKFNPTSATDGGGHNPHLVMTRMTKNGISTTLAGQEQYETFYLRQRGKRVRRIMYDYRMEDGELFSVVAPTLEECRQKRDEWLTKKK